MAAAQAHVGKLIVIEGPEGAGKSTQVARLSNWLGTAGVPHHAFREPGGTALGESIRHILLWDSEAKITASAEAALFMASRAELIERVVRPALFRGNTVVLDRFFLSTYAYQIFGRDLDEHDVRSANALAVGRLVPDITFLLHLPFEDGLRRADGRGARDRMERAGDAFHRRVQDGYEAFATEAWQRDHPECGPIVVIDARHTPDRIEREISEELVRRWPASFGRTLISH